MSDPQHISGEDGWPSRRVGGSTADSTFYSYLGTPAWRFNDVTPLLSPDQRTWSQFAGYARVKVSHGSENAAGKRETVVTTYMRGLHGTASNTTGGDPNGANVTYGYHVSAVGPSWISTRTRTAGTWYMSYQIFDGLGRDRQTQQQAPNNTGAPPAS